MTQLRRVAIIGGNRIPFARSNGPYATASNQAMLTAALEGLIERYNLHGLRLGEVAAGAVLKHSRDFNLTRECVLGSRLSPTTPAYDIQQACGTGLEAALLVANKIALGQIDCGIAGGVDTTSDAPIGVNEGLRKILLQANRAKSTGDKLKTLLQLRPHHLKPELPRNGEPRTGLSMGEHCEQMAKTWNIARADQDQLALESHQKMAAAYAEGWQDDLITPFLGLTRDNNLRPDLTLEKLASLKPAFDRSASGTLTAGNSTPLTDGASLVLLGSEAWAREQGLPVLAYLRDGEAAAVDFVNGAEGAADGPGIRRAALAGAKWPEPAGLRLLRDPRGLRGPGAVHPQGLGRPRVLQGQAGPGGTSGQHRSRPAQRQRQFPGGRAPVCRHRRAHRRQPGEAAECGGAGARADFHLCRGRPGRDGDHRALRFVAFPGTQAPTQKCRPSVGAGLPAKASSGLEAPYQGVQLIG